MIRPKVRDAEVGGAARARREPGERVPPGLPDRGGSAAPPAMNYLAHVHLGSRSDGFLVGETQQVQDVRVGTETAAAYADSKLIPQDGRSQEVRSSG